MGLRLFNTMGRKLEDFVPIKPGFAGFYGCGPTVYNYAHIGNLRAYVFIDILDRTLSFLGYKIKHVMNITDIGHLTGDGDAGEDKMLKSARERHESVLDVAKFYTQAFFNDLDSLNIRRPDVVCKATEHVQDMIELIKRIEANGHTYMSGGNLYFDVSTYKDYGKLSGLNLSDLKAGARIAVDENKRSPYDFVLWFTKSKFENQALCWDSPWGRGYPGWHIECSAMSMKYLGEHFDIHTGGIDHIPIHHTNEIAQSEGATGHKWVNYWLHNEFLVISGAKGDKEAGKMSKSAGNFLTLQSLLDKGYEALDYRFFLLGTHYRKQIYFSWEAMDGAKKARKSLVQRIAKVLNALPSDDGKNQAGKALQECVSGGKAISGETSSGSGGAFVPAIGEKAKNYLAAFKAALENDLSTPQALRELQTAVKDQALSAEETVYLVREMDKVLALNLEEEAKKLNISSSSVNEGDTVSGMQAEEIEALVKERTAAKKAKDFAKADKIRNDLAEKGIIIVDTPDGSVWKRG
ncbi:cysteine--tRNA ligase [Treponema parvum]|uniref:Cysteine--tRNA ligase n=1 Tax=Treponema parvum TaxID=138851 RepID=A0A975EYX5_9SPIR|nr:cysteine--tRNA ligase [Treponema parvum]QTQ11260.1 cysteine--tRNA ligase [Treponema parvum]